MGVDRMWLNEEGDKGCIVAPRDTEVGEELLVSYIDEEERWERRQMMLKRIWGFDCGCERCVREFGGGGKVELGGKYAVTWRAANEARTRTLGFCNGFMDVK